MRTLRLEILWTKKGTLAHSRQREVSLEIPTEGETTEVQDALLSLPGWTPDANYGESRTVHLPDPLDALTDEVVLEVAIPQARAEMEGEARKDAERREAKLAEERVKLAAFASGGDDPGYPLTERRAIDWLVPTIHHSLDKVAVEHIVVSHGKEALEGHDELRARVDARMEEINAVARERAEAELVDKETAQTERERLNAEKEAIKQERADARAAEIAEWARKYGSARLQEQLAQGLRGWPLYLHERMLADWSGGLVEPKLVPELDNDGETDDALIDPEEDQLLLARRVAEHAVFLDMYPSMDAAFERIAIVPIKIIPEEVEDGYGYDTDDPSFTKVYVTFSGYRPGSEAFAEKSIRFCCDTND